MEKNIQMDIDKAHEILKEGTRPAFGSHSLIFPFSTENLNGYYDKLDLKGKKVLTVASSGDHALSAILYGANDVNCFDINRFTMYYNNLKKAAITNLDYKTFLQIFKQEECLMFDLKTYERIRDLLDSKSKLFWDFLYDNFYYEQIANHLFRHECSSKSRISASIPYLNSNNYYKLQESLPQQNIEFIESCITKLHQNLKGDKYDSMILSNITDWIAKDRSSEQLKKVKDIILKLSTNLNDRGIIMMAYLFCYISYEEMQPLDKMGTIFDTNECDKIYISGWIPETEDLVLVYKKKFK